MPTSKATLRGATLDPIDGGSLTYFVDGLSGNTAEIMIQACEAGGIPQRNDVFSPGLKVTGGPRVSQMLGNFSAMVEVTIGKDENQQGSGGTTGSFELATRLVEEKTVLDVDGKPIIVRFDATRTTLNPSLNTPSTVDGVTTITESLTQTGEVIRKVPLTVLRHTRVENTLPINQQYRHVGTTNSTIFFLFPPEYWLCAEISASSVDNGRTYTVTREFWGNQYGWLQGVAYRMEDGRLGKVTPPPELQAFPPRLRLLAGGMPNPDSITNGIVNQSWFNGLTLVRVQGMSDFTPMDILPPENIDS